MAYKSVRIEVLEKSINKAKRRIAYLEKCIDGDHLGDMIKARGKQGEVAGKFRAISTSERTPEDLFAYADGMEAAIKEEKEARARHNKQMESTDEWMEEIGVLTFQIQVLHRDLMLEKMRVEAGR